MKFEFNGEFLLADGKVIAEINAPEGTAGTLFDSKTSVGVSRIINEKNELQVKYDTLRKDYALLRHECKQKEELIKTLEEVQEGLLRKNHVLLETVEDYKERIASFSETINDIKQLIDRE